MNVRVMWGGVLLALAVFATACEGTIESSWVSGLDADGRPIYVGGPNAPTGKELFELHCSTCHGLDATGTSVWPSSIAGFAPVAPIVSTGRGEMPRLEIPAAQVLLIQEYVLTLGPDISGMNGLEAYQVRCAYCHGAEGEGTEFGYQLRYEADAYSKWVARHGRRSTRFPTPMPAFADVSDAQYEEMFAWLGSFPHPEDGRGLYDRYCANCHGANAQGGPVGKEIAGEGFDNEPIREGEGGSNFGDRGEYMPRWSRDALTDTELGLIRQYVSSLPER